MNLYPLPSFTPIAAFDAAAARLASEPVSLTEPALLSASHWSLGEDARLREDLRFRPTPWGRWVLARDFLANDAMQRELLAEQRSHLPLQVLLERLGTRLGRRCVFCPGDKRFVLRHDDVWLSADQLSPQPAFEDAVGDLEKYRTHLPVHTLKAAAACPPLGEWGRAAQEDVIETLGWLQVSVPGRRGYNERMFVARIEGHSMDDGRSGLVHGAYAVFELWPAGTRQDQKVLVRGSFHDPETGSYALKKYVADVRDSAGQHQQITLVSLNPDKSRYPDIELTPAEDDSLAVVAKLVEVLTPEDYARRPKPVRRTGQRLLAGSDGLADQDGRLARQMAAFFEGHAGEQDSDASAAGWCTALACLSVEAGGLCIEVGPLNGLPPFVRKLRIVGHHHWDAILLAANVRQRAERVVVPAGTGPWRIEAVGFEDESDLGLDQLDTEALPTTSVSVFRVDAAGVGQHQSGRSLATGQHYRLLLPPGIDTDCPADALADGWRLWNLDLDACPDADTLRALEALGLSVNEHWPRLSWAVTTPTAWRTSARGEPYPVFLPEDALFVQVSGLAEGESEADAAALFLKGPEGSQRLFLQGPQARLVSLGTLAAGRWACALLHPSTSVPASTLLFEVAEDALPCYPGNWSVSQQQGLESLAIQAPAGWPVTLYWHVLSTQRLATCHADSDGNLDLDAAMPRLLERARRNRVADLIIDAGELGRQTLPQDQLRSTTDISEAIHTLWTPRQTLVASQPGAWLPLMEPWLAPFAALLGYDLEPLDIATVVGPETGMTAWKLVIDERRHQGIERSTARVLIMTPALADGLPDSSLDHIDDICDLARVRDAIISDATRWTTHRVRSRLPRSLWDLSVIGDSEAMSAMLADLAEGL